MITKFDEEIHEVEARLAREREALVNQAEDLGQTAREAAVSPKGLLAAAAVGFMLGELTRPRRAHAKVDAPAQAPRKLGLGGILGGAALAFIKAKYGSPAALSRAAWEFAAATRARANATRTPPSTASAGSRSYATSPDDRSSYTERNDRYAAAAGDRYAESTPRPAAIVTPPPAAPPVP